MPRYSTVPDRGTLLRDGRRPTHAGCTWAAEDPTPRVVTRCTKVAVHEKPLRSAVVEAYDSDRTKHPGQAR